jgi:hypothetical protein
MIYKSSLLICRGTLIYLFEQEIKKKNTSKILIYLLSCKGKHDQIFSTI